MPTTQREGQPVPTAAQSKWTRTSADLPDSTKPVFDIDLSKVSDSVARMLAKNDREVAASNGVEDWRVDAANLNASVRKGEITSEQAAEIFQVCHLTITDADLRGQK